MQFSTLAFAFLSLVLSSQGLTTLYESSDSCEISVNSTTFNLCPLQNIYFNASLPLLGQLSFSVIGNIVPNCANSGYIWGTNYDWARHCNDIALSNPTYINIEPNPNGGYGGLNMTFPLQVSPTTGMAYQVGIVLSCSYSESDSDLDFSVTSLVTGNVTNYAITADTPYGCGIPPSCTPSSLNGAYYNLCDLQTIIFNVTNQFGLQIALTLGQNALLTCPGDISPVLAIVIDKSGKCYKFNPMSGIEPLSPQINYKNGIQMDLYEQSLSDNGKLSSFELTLNCDPNQDPSDIAANVTSIQSTSDSGVTILLTGASPYACPEN